MLNIKEFRKLDVEFTTFAQFAFHGLQEPLRKLSAYSSIFVRDYFHTVDSQGRKYVDIMVDATGRMHNVINDIVEYSELSKCINQFNATNL